MVLNEILIAQITCALNGDAKNILEKFSKTVEEKRGAVLSESSSHHNRVFTVVIQMPKRVEAKEILSLFAKEATVNLIDVGTVVSASPAASLRF